MRIPLLHIADPTGEAIRKAGLKKLGLLGTRFTLQERFLRDRLADGFDLEILAPKEPDQEAVHRVIDDEPTKGIVRPESRRLYCDVIERLADRGAQAIVLACTEIMLLIKESDTTLPVFDSTTLYGRGSRSHVTSPGRARKTLARLRVTVGPSGRPRKRNAGS